ncbi:MAG: hypothetical protein KDJ97_18405 [Anaerolineae bacterium]|nr:hypothetical protein [Anaerolineae bacterium]
MMVQTHGTVKYSTIIVRWIARIWGVASILFVLAFLLGEGLSPTQITPTEWIQLLLFPFSVMGGLLLAWRWEGVGGGLTLVSFVMFYLLHYVVSGNLPQGPFFGLVAAPGLLFLLCWLLSRH